MAKLIGKLLQPYWQVTRGLTMGAQGVVLDEANRVLLVRHSYRPGWHFPGGGVERGEPVHEALARELQEEAGIMLSGPAELHGIFANFKAFPGDHIAVYVVRQWQQPSVPGRNAEIAEQGFFARAALPGGTVAAVQRRLDEILAAAMPDPYW